MEQNKGIDCEAGTADTNAKHFITKCADEDKMLEIFDFVTTYTVETDCRLKGMEIKLQDMGIHFVKYQEDVVGILVQECARLDQQMKHQEEKMQKTVHELVQAAVSSAKEEIMKEINAERSYKQHYPLRRADLSVDTVCKEESCTQETSSTTSACEDSESNAESLRSIGELRKAIDAARSEFQIHTDEMEKRLRLLEAGSTQHLELQNSDTSITNTDNSNAGSYEIPMIAEAAKSAHDFSSLEKMLDNSKAVPWTSMDVLRQTTNSQLSRSLCVSPKMPPDMVNMSGSARRVPSTPLPSFCREVRQDKMRVPPSHVSLSGGSPERRSFGSPCSNKDRECDKIPTTVRNAANHVQGQKTQSGSSPSIHSQILTNPPPPVTAGQLASNGRAQVRMASPNATRVLQMSSRSPSRLK